MKIKGIGIDIVEINRFKRLKIECRFIESNFSKIEIAHALSYKDWSTHLAGTFAAKESVVKALGKSNIPQASIEIIRNLAGAPEVYIKGKRAKNILTTISHSGKVAVAFSLKL